ncbi:MAG: ABC transporter permease subunit [Gemmatimonadetes bacterium]|nr:ABC transporter permease subunit [Gemmatimonadota bacterium]
MRRSWKGLAAAGVVAAPVGVGVVYAAAAAVGLVGVSRPDGASGQRVARVLAEPAVWESTLWSLWVASASTILAGAAALGTAAVFRGPGRLDRSARSAAVLPLPIPHLVAGVLGLLILGQSGLLGRAAYALRLVQAPADVPALVYDGWGVGLILTLAWKEFAFLVLVAWSALAERGAALEEAARTLGASPGQTFRRVTAPVLLRAMLPAGVAVFTFILGSFEVAALLGPSDPLPLPVLTLERYTDADLGRRSDAFVLALLGIGLAALAVGGHEWARSRWPDLEG